MRETYNKNMLQIESQIAKMIIKEQQLLQTSGLGKKEQAIKLKILERQFAN